MNDYGFSNVDGALSRLDADSIELTEQEVKSKVRALMALMKPEWRFAAYDIEGWCFYRNNPYPSDGFWMTKRGTDWTTLEKALDFPEFPGNWRDSLVGRE